MAKNILSKEDFVYMVMEEQNTKKELGVKLEKINDNDFNEILTEILLQYGEVKEKVKSTVKQTVNNLTKSVKEKESKKVVKEVQPKKTEIIKETVNDTTKSIKEKELKKVGQEVNTKVKNTVVKIEGKTISKVEKLKPETKKTIESNIKTKEIRRRDGLMQLAFDF